MIKKQKAATKGVKDNNNSQAPSVNQAKKLSEYGKQLAEKQKVKKIYGMRERQFRNFFELAKKSKNATGSMLLSLLERRIDNVILKLKFASTITQARQMVVHGHVKLNDKSVYSPSMLVKVGDIITISQASVKKEGFMKEIVEKSIVKGIKIPEWLELDKDKYLGRILRMPDRSDIQAAINENFIVELYSK